MDDFKNALIRLRSKGANGAWLVDPGLRPKLVADAEEKGTNLTEIAVEILARRYDVAVIANGRKSSPQANDETMLLRLPWHLYTAISAASAVNHRSGYQDEIRATLSAHYGLRFPPRSAAVAA